VVFPAKLMAMCVIDLLSEGAVEAKRVKEEFRPVLTKEKYLTLMEDLREPLTI
jgi:hypothetical protein